MQEIYRFIDDAIEADRQRYTDIADQIWDHPETRFEEFWSAEHPRRPVKMVTVADTICWEPPPLPLQ